jgi:hypothetical protein
MQQRERVGLTSALEPAGLELSGATGDGAIGVARRPADPLAEVQSE